MENRIQSIEENIKAIKENHLHHMEIDIAETKTNVNWLMDSHKAQRAVLYTIIGGVLLTIILVALKLK